MNIRFKCLRDLDAIAFVLFLWQKTWPLVFYDYKHLTRIILSISRSVALICYFNRGVNEPILFHSTPSFKKRHAIEIFQVDFCVNAYFFGFPFF